jgi:uncharacterized phiE125 gp8 family phage protein
MRPMLIGAPAIEPVTLAEIKAWLREDDPDEDDLIQALAVSARMTLEAYTRRFFMTQSWRINLDSWPCPAREMILPFAPFQSVSSIRVFDADDVAQTLATTDYRAPPDSTGGRLTFSVAPPAPGRQTDGVEIDFTVGYGAAANQAPEPLRRAIMVLVAHWREKRGDARDDALPLAVAQLVAPFRRMRL